MMNITFECLGCQQKLVIEEAGAGLEIQCPQCGLPCTVPGLQAGLVIQDSTHRSLTEISPWSDVGKDGCCAVADASSEQQAFYRHWLSELEQGRFVQIDWQSHWYGGYIYAYLYEVIREFLKDQDLQKLNECFDRVWRGYVADYDEDDISKYDIKFLRESLIIWRSDAHIYLGDFEKVKTSVEAMIPESKSVERDTTDPP